MRKVVASSLCHLQMGDKICAFTSIYIHTITFTLRLTKMSKGVCYLLLAVISLKIIAALLASFGISYTYANLFFMNSDIKNESRREKTLKKIIIIVFTIFLFPAIFFQEYPFILYTFYLTWGSIGMIAMIIELFNR